MWCNSSALTKKSEDSGLDLDRKLCNEIGWPEICAWSGVIFVNDGRLLSLRIIIRDINDNIPKWLTKDNMDKPILEIWIIENSPLGTIYDLPLAYDPDIGENSIVKYEIANINHIDNNTLSLFQIINLPNPNGPIFQMIINGILDRELLSLYELTVAAVDGGGNRGYAKLIIHIADENDNSPIFKHCNNSYINKTELIMKQTCEMIVNIDEDIPVGSTLPVHPIANDMDEGEFGHVTYRFALSAPDVARRDFKIDRETGAIIVRAALDYDTGGLTQYIFNIVAEDGGLPPLTATTRIIINIQDKNDNAPQITITPAFLQEDNYKSLVYYQNKTKLTNIDTMKSTLRLIENTSPGALIATITAYDPDSEENELRVTLKCEDNGINNKQKTIELLTIHILDINDNSPKYTNKRYSFQCVSIPINVLDYFCHITFITRVDLTLSDTVKTKVTALDPDLGLNGELNYSIHWPPGQGPNPFEVNEKGELITRMPLDRENQPEGYHFIVNVHDNGEPQLSGSTHVEIALIDVNDCRPIFTQINYHFSVDEELEMNYTVESYVIGQVKATDCDIGLNAQLIYSLDTTINYKMDHPFQVTEDGYVKATKSTDRETHPAFLLQVLATDNPQTPEKQLTATAQVHITILDINDNEPVFQRPPFDNGTNEVEISYNDVPGHLITKVEAIDKDIGANGKILFSFNHKQSINPMFVIRENTGEIFLQKELSIKDIGTIPLVILATDMGLVPRTTTTTIFIKISDRPTNMFRFNALNQQDSSGQQLTTSLFANFNKSTITTKPMTTYNDNTNGYHTSIVEKSPPDITNVSIPGKSVNYPFDCIDVNTFEQNTNYLPSFYEQTTSMTIPYTFHETGLRFYDQLMPTNDELLNG
ncbi:cadherin, putative [Schistosoma mansoni]|uniref:cadherin, putative n=1 Tax=Schistosoma mansoni TaxID=6183 RepID=UPI00022C83F6|nr:cadherin, putative [Schistosoma mansoni]|eukprot:XP_018645347.1 cadherin, putative [Schistosoma mansoni]